MFIIPTWAVLNEIEWIAEANHISLSCRLLFFGGTITEMKKERCGFSAQAKFVSVEQPELAARAVEAGMA
jgi:hypothetical protein